MVKIERGPRGFVAFLSSLPGVGSFSIKLPGRFLSLLPSKFALVPLCEWLEPESPLNMAERIVYMVLCRFAGNATGQCWPSIDTIAEHAACTDKTVRRAILKLEQVGAVTIERRKKNGKDMPNLYTVVGYTDLFKGVNGTPIRGKDRPPKGVNGAPVGGYSRPPNSVVNSEKNLGAGVGSDEPAAPLTAEEIAERAEIRDGLRRAFGISLPH